MKNSCCTNLHPPIECTLGRKCFNTHHNTITRLLDFPIPIGLQYLYSTCVSEQDLRHWYDPNHIHEDSCKEYE